MNVIFIAMRLLKVKHSNFVLSIKVQDLIDHFQLNCELPFWNEIFYRWDEFKLFFSWFMWIDLFQWRLFIFVIYLMRIDFPLLNFLQTVITLRQHISTLTKFIICKTHLLKTLNNYLIIRNGLLAHVTTSVWTFKKKKKQYLLVSPQNVIHKSIPSS